MSSKPCDECNSGTKEYCDICSVWECDNVNCRHFGWKANNKVRDSLADIEAHDLVRAECLGGK